MRQCKEETQYDHSGNMSVEGSGSRLRRCGQFGGSSCCHTVERRGHPRVEDISNAGVTSLGILSNIHNPQVFVSRRDQMLAADRIRELLKPPDSSGDTNRFCYHCGAEATASSESCSTCGASIDRELDSQTEQPESSNLNVVGSMNTFFRRLGKWGASLSILYVAGMLLYGIFGGLYMVVNSILWR